MRVVLYAEGSRELGSAARVAAGDVIAEDAHGAAHVLLRRCLVAIGFHDVVFEGPLRPRGARPLKGSDLLVRKNLIRALTWARPEKRPDLAAIFVDADGEANRHAKLTAILEERDQRSIAAVVGVAVQEFEAWLVADQPAVHEVVGETFPAAPDPQSMPPGGAKRLLDSWIGRTDDERERHCTHRREIAERCDLDRVEKRCRAFGQFRRELRAALGR